MKLMIQGFNVATLPCSIRRTRDALCGFVEVPQGHPWHGVHHDDVDAPVVLASSHASKRGWVLGFRLSTERDDDDAISLTTRLAAAAFEVSFPYVQEVN